MVQLAINFFLTNLAATGKLNDKVISNNNDAEKVLVPIAIGIVSAVYAFTDKYPDAWVYATGSTSARTRLYRIGITKYLDEVQNDFYIFGESGDK